jgi:hypothetical protein
MSVAPHRGWAEVAIVALVALSWAAPVSGAKLPDWAQAIADSAPVVEESNDRYSYRVLLMERQVVVHVDGTLTIRDRLAKQALRADAEEVGAGMMFLGSNQELKRSRAWHQPPEGRAKKSRRTMSLDLTDTSTFMSDNKARAVVMPDVTRGSLVFFEFEAIWTPYALSFSHLFAEEEPVLVARLVVQAPPSWQVRHQWLRGQEVDPVTNVGSWTWQLEDLANEDREAISESLAERAPRLAVGLVPPDGAIGVGAPAFADWGEMSAWMTDLIGDRNQLAAGVARQAVPQTGDAGDSLARTLLVSRFVRDSVRYVAKEIGIGGYQPRPVAETLDTLWGDCKDKSTLLNALLAAEGLSSYPVLVNAAYDETTADQIPTLDAFNHAILAVAVAADVTPPEHVEAAMLEDDQLGRLLIVDTTDEYTTPGWIAEELAGKRALLVNGGQGKLITLPGDRPEDHRLERNLQVHINHDGSVSFQRTSRHLGEPAWNHRTNLRSSARDSREAVEEEIRDLWIGATIESYETTHETPEGAFDEQVRWQIQSLPASQDETTLRLFAGATDLLPRTSLRRRQLPVAYNYPRLLQWTTTVKGAPQGVELPSAKSLTGDGWVFSIEYAQTESTVTAKLEIRLERTHYPLEAFRDLRKLYSAIAAAEKAVLVIS